MDEDPNQAAIREIVDMIYFAKSKTDVVVLESQDLSNDWKWLTKEELEKNTLGLGERTRLHASMALKRVVG